MTQLVGQPSDTDSELLQLVQDAIYDPHITSHPELHAGLWLYADQLERSHRISQSISSPTGSYWHGIMHRREGDFWNSKYWFRQAANHPAMQSSRLTDYNPFDFVDAVEATHQAGEDHSLDLIHIQQQEWRMLFDWCLANANKTTL
ncbi:hypothetical protein [Poriferisphaera sp. WC338]|uniref:hypothetical protein n=1 Tax=Poriferisphaera sp. WC338 TaxID=3425129 RepID=UPI003D815815